MFSSARFTSRALVIGALAALTLVVPRQLAAQTALTSERPRAIAAAKDSLFTAEDGLEVVSYTALDLTSDGRWLAAKSASRRDLLGVDYRRDGDPTYIRPSA